MASKILAIFKSPYPADSSPLATVFYSLGSGLFVTLFFAVFEPFGFFLLPRAPRWTLYIGYGLITGAAIILNNQLLPRLWPRFFKEENWSLGRQILFMGWVTLAIGLGCTLLSGAVCAHFGLSAQWVRLRTIVFDTFIIAILPITVINLINYALLLRRNTRVVVEANCRLEHPAALLPLPGKTAAPLPVEIVAENNKDSFRVALADLLFIQAEENYVQVFHKGEKPGRVLLRSSLTRVERQLRPFFPQLFRCHRTCIVNIAQIVKVAGNAQGLKLTLRDYAATLPVARHYVSEFRQVMRSR
ncbi:MAG: LytTR family DNA-binding domain-containing protein [Candidatus Aminicenantes bacterium]|nr:LytTR family DNA-binding domain-containing protein [Candidatus Aminicenantes bacterium]